MNDKLKVFEVIRESPQFHEIFNRELTDKEYDKLTRYIKQAIAKAKQEQIKDEIKWLQDVFWRKGIRIKDMELINDRVDKLNQQITGDKAT